MIFYEPVPEMWTLHIGGSPILRQSFAFGSAGNLAMLFTMRYRDLRPVEELKFLAAHSVIEAHTFNPSVVDGLELWSCIDGRVERASKAELTKLSERSVRFDKFIDTHLFAR